MVQFKSFTILAVALQVLLLTGCTPTSDPVVDEIMAADLGELRAVSDEVKGYCYPTELFCSSPLFEPAFSAPASADPAAVCDSVIDLQLKIGLVAYSVSGDGAYPMEDPTQVRELCSNGLSQLLETDDGFTYYLGVVLYDDGAKDGVGKVTVVHRENDGSYLVVFSVSRNLDRVGWISYADQS